MTLLRPFDWAGDYASLGLPSWPAATGLRVPVKQPDSRGILCFFVAM